MCCALRCSTEISSHQMVSTRASRHITHLDASTTVNRQYDNISAEQHSTTREGNTTVYTAITLFNFCCVVASFHCVLLCALCCVAVYFRVLLLHSMHRLMLVRCTVLCCVVLLCNCVVLHLCCCRRIGGQFNKETASVLSYNCRVRM